jgi:hypothetical protein
MIFMPRSVLSNIRRGHNQACFKIMIEDIEISIAMDDSCGAMENVGRTSIAIFENSGTEQETNITKLLFKEARQGEIYRPNADTLVEAIERVKHYLKERSN